MSETIRLFLKGLAMGAANIIPGVSGGTVALVTGIYRRLIEAIRSIDSDALRLLFRLPKMGSSVPGVVCRRCKATQPLSSEFLSAATGATYSRLTENIR